MGIGLRGHIPTDKLALMRLESPFKKVYIIDMTDFLFARPSALEGIGRNIDLFGVLNYYNTSQSGREADMRARSNDIKTLKKDAFVVCEKVIDGNQRRNK